MLPTKPDERKTYPIATGVLDYFPDAIAAVAYLSFRGNQQHNPGQPLHWARENPWTTRTASFATSSKGGPSIPTVSPTPRR